MKLNTRVGLARKEEQGPTIQDLQAEIKALHEEIKRLQAKEPVVVEKLIQPAKRKFAFDVRRDRNGNIEKIVATEE
jgi:hypothetical protein